MGIPTRSNAFIRFLKDPFLYDLLLAFLAFALALIAAINSKPDAPIGKWTIIIGAGVVLILTALKHILAFCGRLKTVSTHELEGCLHSLHAAINFENETVLRFTIYVPIDDKTLEQVIDYVGVNPKNRVGRKISARSGVVGQAFRLKEPVVGTRGASDNEQFVVDLMREWNFTEEEARAINPSTKEWYAVPLIRDIDGKKIVAGVFYCDTQKEGFLTRERQLFIAQGAAGIARFVGIKYG